MITSIQVGALLNPVERWTNYLPFLRDDFLIQNHLAQRLSELDVERSRYLLHNLVDHAATANHSQQLRQLLTNLEFLAVKLADVGIQPLLDDFNRVLQPVRAIAVEERTGLHLIQQALTLAAPILRHEPTQLPEQLLARLLVYDRYPVQELLHQAQHYKTGMWLRPISASLTRPDGPLRATLALEQPGWLTALTITPDGQHVIAASDDFLSIWAMSSGHLIETQTIPVSDITALTAVPNGNVIAVATRNGDLLLWDWQQRQPRSCQQAHEGAILALANLGEDQLATAATDSKIKIWLVPQGALHKVFIGHGEGVGAVAVSPDGQRLYSGGGSTFGAAIHRVIYVWDTATATHLNTLGPHDWPVEQVAITSDGQTVIAAANDVITVWDLFTKTKRLTLSGQHTRIQTIIITPDDRWLISAGSDALIKIWELGSGRLVTTLRSHTALISDLAITPNGKYLVSTSWDQTAKVWDLDRIEQTTAVSGHTGAITSLAISADSQHLLSAAKDHTLKVWDLQSRHERFTLLGHSHWVMDCAITADGKWAISAAWDQTLKIWDLVQGVECFTLTGHTEHINAVAITKDGSRAVSGTNQGEIKIWDLERRIVLFSWRGHQKAINALLLLPGDHLVLSIADDETIRGWEIATGEARFVLSLNNEPQPATTDEIERLRLRQQHNMRMTTIAVLPSAGTQVITGGWNHTLYLWDLESQAEVGMLHGCTSGITDVVVSPDGRFVLTTGGLPHISSDNMIRVWDLTQRKEIAHFTAEAPLTACAFSPDGHTIVAGDDQGNLHYLRLENG